jgi:hypothetical protein
MNQEEWRIEVLDRVTWTEYTRGFKTKDEAEFYAKARCLSEWFNGVRYSVVTPFEAIA